MEFPVHIQINWPPDGDQDALLRLLASEADRARELAAEGFIRRLWRDRGKRAKWGIWEAPDVTTLHAAIVSLPLFNWLVVQVHPLAGHPSDPERPGGR